MVANCDHLSNLRFSKALPAAFTEHGAIMAASVLNSPRAVELSIFAVRAFVALRRTLAADAQLARKLSQLERRLADHDDRILSIVRAIRELSGAAPVQPKRRIGFKP